MKLSSSLASATRPVAARPRTHTPVRAVATTSDCNCDVAIVGGGPCGQAIAVGLRRAAPSLRVAVLERSDALRPVGFTIGLFGNGLDALAALDPSLGAAIKHGMLPDGPMVQYKADDPSVINFSAPSTSGIFAGLSSTTGHFPWFRLVEACAARLPPGVLRLNHAFDRYEEDGDGITIHTRTRSGEANPPLRASILVGADGNLSGVRAALLGDGPPTFTGLAVWRGQCPAPPGWGDKHGSNLLTGWGKGRFIFLVVDLGGGNLAWQAYAPWPEARLGELASARVTDAEATVRGDEAKRARCLEAHAGGFAEEALALVRATDASRITEHPQGFREPAACQVWGAGRVTLAGDAAHLSTPFLGQGTGQALEDAVELARAVGVHGPTPAALRAYEGVRVPLATAVQAGSVGIAKEVAAGGKASERAWYAEHPEVLRRVPVPLSAPVV